MHNGENKKPIRSFRDLEVYQNTYGAMLTVAEGYAKRHQKAGFQKYTDDAMGECNETVVSLEQCRDLYGIDKKLIDSLVDTYDKAGRQLYKLSLAWTTFKKRETKPINDTGFVTD